MKKNIVINDWTDRKELIEAINIFEIQCRTTILKFVIYSGHTFTMIEFDGNCVTQWTGNIDDFIAFKMLNLTVTYIM